MDISELIQTEEDYTLQEFFPKTIPYHLQPLLEHRIKLLSKEDTVFYGGEIKLVTTCCVLNRKIKGTKLSKFLIPCENMPLVFESGGYISENCTGRLFAEASQLFLKDHQTSVWNSYWIPSVAAL